MNLNNFITAILYISTYSLILIHLIWGALVLMKVTPILNDVTTVEFTGYCLLPILSHFMLNLRYQFDFFTLQEGASMPSIFFSTILIVLFNSMFIIVLFMDS